MTAAGHIPFKFYTWAAGQIATAYLTRCTRGDARSFSVLTKRICMHKINFLRIYSNIVLKDILI